jgi:death-on-curing protein
MTSIRWLNQQALIFLHSETLAENGGVDGIRDEGLLESALYRPLNLYNYEQETDIATLAAAYGFGIVRNHPFVDGNKRAVFFGSGFISRLEWIYFNSISITSNSNYDSFSGRRNIRT